MVRNLLMLFTLLGIMIFDCRLVLLSYIELADILERCRLFSGGHDSVCAMFVLFSTHILRSIDFVC